MNERYFLRQKIEWQTIFGIFFHEHGHVLQLDIKAGRASSEFPEDVERLLTGFLLYVTAKVSQDLYGANPAELHSQEMEAIGGRAYDELRKTLK